MPEYVTKPQVQFRSPEVEAALAARVHSPFDSPGAVAKRDLERYYYLLAEALASVTLTEGEAMLVCDVANGLYHEPFTLQLIWAEIADAITIDGLDQKWGVDGPVLVAKLRGLSLFQSAAVVDAAERFWQRTSVDETNTERVRAVGLVH